MKNNKGFTLIEIIAVIVILSIVLMVGVYALNGYLIKGREKSFNLLVNSFQDSVRTAFTACESDSSDSSFCANHPLPEPGQSATITLSELIDNGYIEPVKNPWNKNELCNGASTVEVTRNLVEVKHKKKDETIEILGTDSTIIDLSYKTCLICGTHSSDGC